MESFSEFLFQLFAIHNNPDRGKWLHQVLVQIERPHRQGERFPGTALAGHQQSTRTGSDGFPLPGCRLQISRQEGCSISLHCLQKACGNDQPVVIYEYLVNSRSSNGTLS
ncbi:hypothetical protein D3C78_989050 [compost metagenome]